MEEIRIVPQVLENLPTESKATEFEHRSTFDSSTSKLKEPSIPVSPQLGAFYLPSDIMEYTDFSTEYDQSPAKLDPLSKEFPFSIPNNRYESYMDARESLFREEGARIKTRIDPERSMARREHRKDQRGDSACKCLIY